MISFQSPERRPVRNFLARREQLRLLLLVMALGLVVVIMFETRKPKTAARLAAVFGDAARGEASDEARGAASDEKGSESRLGAEGTKPLPPGEFRLATAEADRQGAPSSGLFTGIDRELLRSVEDNTYFRVAESPAWFHFIEILQRTPAEELATTPLLQADYVQLTRQPDVYRGRVVTVRGNVLQVTPQTPAANDLGLDIYYRVVVQPDDGAGWPIFVYCLEAPDELAALEGELARESGQSIAVAGLFFKNLSYVAQEGMGIAPVLLAKRISLAPASPDRTASETQRASIGESQTGVALAAERPEEATPDAATPEESLHQATPFQEVLRLAGWDAERLSTFSDGPPLTGTERVELLDLLRRMRTFDAADLEVWRKAASTAGTAPTQARRGELVRLAGRVRQVTRHPLAASDAARLEMPEYFECELALDQDAGYATILAPHIPAAWLNLKTLDEPATVDGVLIKRLAPNEVGTKDFAQAEAPAPRALFVAKRIAWHPTRGRPPHVSLGQAILGTLGMDVGLLDEVRNHRPILATEREAFYQMLHTAGRAEAGKLIEYAQRNLKTFSEGFSPALQSADQASRALADEVVRRAADGRYSVAPLFNVADRHVGQLWVVDGIARRAVRVEVGPQTEDVTNDVFERLGIDHYFEMEVFTDDSQNRPIVFCVRQLPAGFPEGGNIREPVRIAGFFFKSWRYQTRGSAAADDVADKPLIAPLLIGRAPLLLAGQTAGGGWTGLLGGSLFMLALAGVWLAAWWYARGDRQFRLRRQAMGLSLPVEKSGGEHDFSAIDSFPQITEHSEFGASEQP